MNTTIEIKNMMNGAFSISDLNSLCWHMGISFENMTSNYNNRELAIIDIVQHFQRRGTTDELLDAIACARPHLTGRINEVRRALSLAEKEPPPPPAEVNVQMEEVRRNYVAEMRVLAVQMLSLCDEMDKERQAINGG